MSDPSADRDPFEVVAESFLERFRAGQRPSIDEYAARHPELAEQIRELLPALVMVEQDLTFDRHPASGGSRAFAPPSSWKERRLGDYRILREVGRGGMGVVYEAEQVSLGRRVALKVLPGHLARDGTASERFRREAKAAARLHHTNIVPVFEVGREGEVAYYAMQFIRGQGLDQIVEELRRLRDPGRQDDGFETAGSGGREGAATLVGPRIGSPSSPQGRQTVRTMGMLLTGRLAPEGSGAPGRGEDAAPRPAGTERCEPDASPGARPEAPRLDARPGPSPSAVLPGGKHVSEVDTSGHRRPYFRSVAQIGRQAAQGLAYAHARGVIHRDIKPSNLLLDTEGVVWITDFGLAKADDDGLTASGDILGTLRYMAPERFRGEGDARADIYALGLTLHELLTLRPAFDSSDRLGLIERIKNEEPARPRSTDPQIPRDLQTIVLKAIDKHPEHRYPTADALSEDLRRFLADEPIKARQIGISERYWRWARRNPAVAALGGVLAAVLVLATIGSALSAGRFASLAEREGNSAASERSARREADRHRKAAETANAAAQAEARRALLSEGKAVAERKRADATLADSFTSRGLLAGERDSPAEAALWFASAARQSATAEDSRRLEDNRLRARNWMRRAVLPVGAISLPDQGIAPVQLDFQPRGNVLLVRLNRGVVVFWSWRDGGRLAWAESLAGVASAQFSPDGASVALGFLPGEVQIRRVADGEVLARIGHPGPVTALAFSPDGRFLAVAGRVARVWDIQGRAFLDPSWAHPQQVVAVGFNRAGDRLITACRDKRARVFAVGGDDRGEPLHAPWVHLPESLPALIDDDRTLVTVSGDSELTRRDMATGKTASKPIRTGAWGLQGVVASPDGRWFATGGYYGPELYAADAGRAPAHPGHTNQVKKSAFSPDATLLLSVSMDQTARLWSLPDGRPLLAPLKHMANVDGCAWSDDSRHLATAQNDGLIRVWRRPADDLVIARESDWGQRPRISPDGRLAVPGFWHEAPTANKHQGVGRLRVVSTADGRPAGPDIAPPGALVDSCACGDDLAVAAVSSRGEAGNLGVWDLATARPRFEPIALPGPPNSVAARPGSDQLAVICSTSDLLVIDGRTGRQVRALRHEAWTKSEKSVRVQYSPDGKTLVSLGGGVAATINVRDADSGRLRFAPLRSNEAGSNFHGFSLSADGRLLATITLVKNSVQVWDLATGRALSVPLPHPGDYWGLFSVRFSPDGRHLLTGHKDGQARYWDWQAGKLACPPMTHDHEVHDAAITPDGRFALTATGGRPEVHAWELTTGRRVAPPVRLGPFETDWCLALAITPDGRKALASYSKSLTTGVDLAMVDLEAMLSPSATPTADLEQLAELAAAHRIEIGDLSGLTTDQWRAQWDLLREKNPDLAPAGGRPPDDRPGSLVPTEIEMAGNLVKSGVAASRQGRFADAVGDLRRAIPRLQALRRALPDDPQLARLHGLGLGALAASLRGQKRSGEALARARESLAQYESIHGPGPADLYHMAGACAMMSALDVGGPAGDRERLLARGVESLRRAVEGDRSRILPMIPGDRDLDPFRDRDDFRVMMADATFPRDPFEQP